MINSNTAAQSLRVKIFRRQGKCDDQVVLLKEIDCLCVYVSWLSLELYESGVEPDNNIKVCATMYMSVLI